MNCEELHHLRDLYVDEELAAPVTAMVEAHLKSCADCQLRIVRVRALKASIRQTALRYAAPPLLAARLRRDTKTSLASRFGGLRHLRTGWNPVAIAASLLLAIATSVGVTDSYVAPHHEDHVVAEVVASHVRSLMGDHLTDVSFSQQPALRSFFAGKVEVLPPAVEMASAGYTLVGGRLDYVANHRCAALVFRHDKQVINLEMWSRDDGDPDVTESYTRDGYNLVHLTEGNMDYWAISNLSTPELGDFMRDFATAAERSDEKI